MESKNFFSKIVSTENIGKEIHCNGIISIENLDMLNISNENISTKMIHGDLGLQISQDSRLWLCINGIAFLRFRPL